MADKPRRPLRRLFPSLAVLHRTVGIFALVFVITLAVTGILLNHVSPLGLDERYLRNELILDWYNIEAALPETGYPVNGGVVARVGDRLYFGSGREIAAGVSAFAGAAGLQLGGINMAALSRGLLLFNREGQRIDLIPWPAGNAGLPDRVGVTAAGLPAAAFGRRQFRMNEALTVWYAGEPVSLSPLPSARLESDQASALRRVYRGSVLSWERMLLDIHSGRILGSLGVWLVDIAAVALLALGASGLVVWTRRGRRRRRRTR